MPHRLMSRVGRRGMVLLLLGIGWTARGLTLLHDPGLHDPDEAILHNLIPIGVRVALWVVAGVLAVVTASSTKVQWVGWSALLVLPLERVTSHLWSALVWAVPGSAWSWVGLRVGDGTPWSIAYVCYWSVTALAIFYLASWHEDDPDRLQTLRNGGT